MQPKEIDLLVIGGGINGVGVAADAAGRGLSVVLCEKDDLANHTSSASSKLIHGGLRYLEQYEFKMVHEALKEREVLLRIAPHLVHPLEFVFPYHKSMRPAWLIRMGLFLYDHLARRKTLHSSKQINLHTKAGGDPLQKKYRRAFTYWDCQTDDARLVVANAQSARRFGAKIYTRTRVVELDLTAAGWLVTTLNEKNETRLFLARAVVNASGAWVAELHKLALGSSAATQMTWVKGSHIIVPRYYDGDHAYILQTEDHRVVFVIPYKNNYTMIGTTDEVYSADPNRVAMDNQERDYLLNTVNQYFSQKLRRTDIVWSFSGIRSLLGEPKRGAAKMTRSYHLEFFATPYPFVSVFGGKLTTYRTLALEVMAKLLDYFPGVRPAWTDQVPLPGGEDLQGLGFDEFKNALKRHYASLPAALMDYYAAQYGTLTYQLLGSAEQLEDLGQMFSKDLYEREVCYLIEREWARTAEDILFRRTKRGLTATADEKARLDEFLLSHQWDPG